MNNEIERHSVCTLPLVTGAEELAAVTVERGVSTSGSGPPKTILPLWLAFLRASASACAEAWRDPTSRNSSKGHLSSQLQQQQQILNLRTPASTWPLKTTVNEWLLNSSSTRSNWTVPMPINTKEIVAWYHMYQWKLKFELTELTEQNQVPVAWEKSETVYPQ